MDNGTIIKVGDGYRFVVQVVGSGPEVLIPGDPMRVLYLRRMRVIKSRSTADKVALKPTRAIVRVPYSVEYEHLGGLVMAKVRQVLRDEYIKELYGRAPLRTEFIAGYMSYDELEASINVDIIS